MIYQRDLLKSKNPLEIQLGMTGCLLMALLKATNLLDQLQAITKALIDEHCIDADLTVYHTKVCKWLYDNKNISIEYCGYSKEFQPDYINIAEFRYANITHFVLLNNSRDVEYDPYFNSQAVRKGTINSYRVYSLKKNSTEM